MRVIYFDCFSGISGDMTLAALVDAGADPTKIEQGLERLFRQSVKLEFDPVVKKGVSAKKLRIVFEGKELEDGQGHHHHHEEEGHHHHHHEEEEHHHHHHEEEVDHQHHHEEEGHHNHHHRHYSDIVSMIEHAEFPAAVAEKALKIFYEIGKAESKIHNIPMEKVHFHEVGAVDSIVDIVGMALALEDLGVERVISSPVAVGSGYVKCDHGLYPVPAPATLEMLKDIPIRPTVEKGELTTPTGAGILAALSDQFGPIPAMTTRSIGYGAGTKELTMQPNVLRVLIGEMES